MAFQPVPDVCLVRFFMHAGTDAASFGLHFAKAGFSESDIDALVAQLESGFFTNLLPYFPASVGLDRIVAWDLESVDGYKQTNPSVLVGSLVGATGGVSPALSTVVTFYSGRRGKWNSGRAYVPGLDEAVVDKNTIETAHANGIVAQFQDLIDTPVAGWTWVIVSRWFNKVLRSPNAIYSNVEFVECRNTRVGVQRRRTYRT